MATSTQKGELIEKIYEYKEKLYRVIENADFHTRLGSDPSLMEIFFNDCNTQVSEESANQTAVENETTGVNKDNFYWNNQNTKLLLHLFQERKERFRDPKVKKKSLWTEIANEFRKHNYTVTEDILDRKMRNMKKTYRTIKDNQKLSGRGRITWEYFETFENIFFDDKTMNIGPTLSSMPSSEQMAEQRDSMSSDNCDLISVPSRDLRTPDYDCSSLSKDSTPLEKCITPSQNSRLPSKDRRPLSRCSISPSTDSRHSSIDSRSSYGHDSIFLTEDYSNPDCSNPQPLRSPEDPFKENKGLKNINTVAQNMSLAELGMDSMMAIEIKQTLEREFDISMTAQDIRNFNFAKLRQISDTAQQGKTYDTNKIDTNNSKGLGTLIRIINDSDMVPDIFVELTTKKEVGRGCVFLLPGVEGCSSIYKSIASGIKSSAWCLQHGVINIPDQSRSVMKSATYLLPHLLEKMKNQKEFLIVGYSFGALIAIELARLLEAKNISGRLILIDGAPDQMKIWIEHYFYHTSQQELQNIILLGLLDMYNTPNKEMLSLELDKCNTWEEKLKIFHTYFPKELNNLTTENQRFICTTIYDHVIAVQDYNVSSLSCLKSPITLLKPTIAVTLFTEQDYGLHKITEGEVQIHYVEGTHVTMMNNEKIILTINEEWKKE